MDNTIKLSIVTPTGEITSGPVKSVVLPGKDGEFGVLPQHSLLVSPLTVGVIEITNVDNTIDAIAINWGYAKVSEYSVDVLVDSAVSLNAKDTSGLADKIKEAQNLVNSVEDSSVSMAAVEAKIASFR
ncbi:MAG: F0F1 ATP synthase subunit epsilon [Epsilonproteobacteria bacterium]|nr:F0F1 ATP synthase subunit epsilon [Campylobacterota bacterium]